MTEIKKDAYKRAYKELNEIFKTFSEDELKKIPSTFIANVQKEMDNDYKFELDKNKDLVHQELMPETKALIVQIYSKYLAPENEKEMWEKYDKFCINEIEKQKHEQYNPDHFLKNRDTKTSVEPKEEIQSTAIIEYKKENIFTQIINKIKSFFRKHN